MDLFVISDKNVLHSLVYGRAQPGWQRGAIGIMAVLTLPLLLGFAGLAIDVGRLMVVRAELQNAADAAALAGAGCLVPRTECSNVGNTPPDFTTAKSTAATAISLNKSEGATLTGSEADGSVTSGYWDLTGVNGLRNGITPGTNDKPAVKVTISRASGKNGGPVTLFFAGFLGAASKPVSATAVAGKIASAPACLMALNGDLTKNGTATWSWPSCDVVANGNIRFTGASGSLTAKGIYCMGASCYSSWTFSPTPVVLSAARPDPWPAVHDGHLNFSALRAAGGACDYIWSTTNRLTNPTLASGVHCFTDSSGLNTSSALIGTGGAGVFLYFGYDNPAIPSGSRLVALTSPPDPAMQGIAVYGTGSFSENGNTWRLYVFGALYFPNRSFSLGGNAGLDNQTVGGTTCLKLVAQSVSLNGDIIGQFSNAGCSVSSGPSTVPQVSLFY